MMSAYIRWVTRHAHAVLLSCALVTIVLLTQVAGLRVEINPDSQLPQDHRYIQALNRLDEVFGEKNLVIIGLFPKSGSIYESGFLMRLQAVTDSIHSLPGVVERSFSSLALPRTTDIHGNNEGFSALPILERIPETKAEAEQLRQRVERNPQFVDVLVARDGSAAAIIADFQFTPALPGYSEIKEAISHAIADENDGSFTVHLGGPAIYMAWLAHYSERMAFFFPLALIVIALVHYEAFRTIQAVILPLVTALLAMLWSLGIFGFLGIPLDPFNVTTPILILAVAAGHAIQLLKRFYEEGPGVIGSREAVIRSIGRVGPVMIIAGLIAALSFFSLLTFQTASIRNFGLLTALGILSALVIEMTFIPAVRSLLPRPTDRERSQERSRHYFDKVTEGISYYLRTGGSRSVLVIALLTAIIFGGFAYQVEIDSSFRQQFFPGVQVRRDDDALNRAFAGTSTLVLLIEGESEGAIDEPVLLTAVDRLQSWLDQEPEVGKTLSFVDFVKRMHAAMNAENPPELIPPSRNLVAQYLLLYSFSASPEDFDSFIDPTHRTCVVRVFLKNDSTRSITQLIARLETRIEEFLPPGYRVEISGSVASSQALNEVMVNGKIRNIIRIAGLIFIVSSLVLRSLVGGLLVAMPLTFSVVMTFGIMGIFGIALDIGTSTISAMAVGIGADYAIYLLFRLREELETGDPLPEALDRTLRTSGKAVLFVSSAIAAGYLTLCFSGFGYHIRLGALVAFAMVVSSIASVTVLPALILCLKPSFLFCQRADDTEFQQRVS